MSLRTFSQEGRVLDEIELLFLRIMGRFDFMLSVSQHLIHINVDTLDSGYAVQRNCNVTSLGANVWDLVCKWDLEVCMVKGWIAKYSAYDATQKKYFIGTDYENTWQNNLKKLEPILHNFRKSGVVSLGIIESNAQFAQLQQDHILSKSQLATSLSKIEKFDILLKQKVDEIKSQELLINDKNEQLLKFQTKITTLELQIVDIGLKGDEIIKLNAENNQLKLDFDNNKRLLTDATSKISMFEKSIIDNEKLTQQNTELTISIGKDKNKIAQMQIKIKRLEESSVDNEKLTQTNTELTSSNEEQKNEIAKMEIKLNELVASNVDNEVLRAENLRLQRELSEDSYNVSNLTEIIELYAECQKENATLKGEILDLQQSDIEGNQDEHLKQQVTAREEDLYSLRQEMKNLKKESEDKIALEMTLREEEILSLKTQVAELRKPKLQKDIDSMAKKIKELTSSNESLDRKMREIKLSESQYKQKNKREIDNLTDNLKLTQQMTEDCNGKLNAKVKEISKLHSQITRMAKDVANNGKFAFSKNDYKPVT